MIAPVLTDQALQSPGVDSLAILQSIDFAGLLKKITRLPLSSPGNLIPPWVVSASNKVAFSPMSGRRFAVSDMDVSS